jgi:hypothetical protein
VIFKNTVKHFSKITVYSLRSQNPLNSTFSKEHQFDCDLKNIFYTFSNRNFFLKRFQMIHFLQFGLKSNF